MLNTLKEKMVGKNWRVCLESYESDILGENETVFSVMFSDTTKT